MNESPLASAKDELAKARRTLDATRHLVAGGYYEDAVSRAYYAIFHAGCALLASIGRTVHSHDGLRAVIGEHFIRPGVIEPRFARVLAQVAAFRNDADYSAVLTFSKEDADDAVRHAEEFTAVVDGVLGARGR